MPAKRTRSTSAKAEDTSGAKPTTSSDSTAAVSKMADIQEEKEDMPKVIMSRAQRRKLKKPPVVVTSEMKEAAKEEKRELRKYLRMIKSNGSRRKLRKFVEKRSREEGDADAIEHAFDSDFRPTKKGRRLE